MHTPSLRNKLSALLFALLLAALFAAFLLLPKRGYSENENRYLTEKPNFSLDALLSGSYTADFESYVTDGFPFRDAWISLKSRLDLAVGRRDTGGVYVTRDGCLIEMFDSIDQAQYDRNLTYLRAAREALEGRLDSFRVLLVPTAAKVWQDRIAPYTADIDQAQLLDQADGLLSLDCLQILSDHREEEIYYRTDHHWTSRGAYYVYEALMGTEALPESAFTIETLSEDFLGTTFSKAGIWFEKDRIEAWQPDTVYTIEHNLDGRLLDSMYDRSFLDKKDKYSVFLGGNQALSVIRTDNPNGRRLMLVKDSYANTFVQFLLPHYEEIHIVDLRSFALPLSAYIEEQQITDLLVLYNLKGFSQETSVFRIAK